MADMITPIDTKSVVEKISRPADTVKDVSSWFKVETIEINFGDTEGRPSEFITLQREYLVKFLETGWVIDAIVEIGSGGHWVQTGGSVTKNKSATLSDTTADGQYYYYTDNDLASIGNPGGRRIIPDSKNIWDDEYGFNPSGTNNCIRSMDVSMSTTTPSADAPAYWTAYQKVRLKRRRIVAEEVMKSMMTSFTYAYNGGRELEDKRYNQVVSLYTLMLQRSESEGNEIVSSGIDVSPLLEEIKNRILSSLDKTEASSEQSTKFITEDAIAEINRKYDGLIAAERSKEVSIGMYNSTIWPTVEAGYERQRQAAILKAKAEGETSAFSIRKTTSETLGSVSINLVNAAAAISKQADERKITVVNLRNNVLKWMLDYVGGRKESYPELEESATLAEQLGFSSATVATSVL